MCPKLFTTKFLACDAQKKFVKIINIGDHWVCVTNKFCEVFLYNSLFDEVNAPTVLQTTSLLRSYPQRDSSSDKLTFHVRKCCQQTENNASLWVLCCRFHNFHLQWYRSFGIFYDESNLIDCITKILHTGSIEIVAGLESKSKVNHGAPVVKRKLHCMCHKRQGRRKLII